MLDKIYPMWEMLTPSTFLTLSQFIRYSLENGNAIWQELKSSTVSE